MTEPQTQTARPTRKEVGEYRRRYVTIKYPTVIACDHKFTGRVPSLNCEDCWYAWFKTAANITEMHTLMVEGGQSALISKYGKKVAKAFRSFLQQELLPERNDGVQEEDGGSQGASSEGGSTDDERGEAETSGSSISNDGQEEQNGELIDQVGGQGEEDNPQHQDESSVSGQ